MNRNLSGYRVLVAEDEFFLAAEIEDALLRACAEVVGPLAGVDEALAQVARDEFDLAVLDINLRGQFAYPIADALNQRGVPFLFASAYLSSEVPLRHRGRSLLAKPYDPSALIEALVTLAAEVLPHSRDGE